MVKISIEQNIRNNNLAPEMEIMKGRRGRESGDKTACTKNSWRLCAMESQRAVFSRKQFQFPPRYG